jgi:hypothetical protein
MLMCILRSALFHRYKHCESAVYGGRLLLKTGDDILDLTERTNDKFSCISFGQDGLDAKRS